MIQRGSAHAPRPYTRDTHVQHTVQAWPHCHNTPQRRRTHKTVLPASTRRGRRRGGYQREGLAEGGGRVGDGGRARAAAGRGQGECPGRGGGASQQAAASGRASSERTASERAADAA